MSDGFIIGPKRAYKDFTLQAVLALTENQRDVHTALTELRSHHITQNSAEIIYAYRTEEGEDCCSNDFGMRLLLCMQRNQVENCLVGLILWSELPIAFLTELRGVGLEAAREICALIPRPNTPDQVSTEYSRLQLTDLPAASPPLFTAKSPRVLTRLIDQQCIDAHTSLTKALHEIKSISPHKFLLLSNNSHFLYCLDAIQLIVDVPITGKNLWKVLSKIQPSELSLGKIRGVKSLLQQLPSGLNSDVRPLFDYLHSLVSLRIQTQQRFPQLSSPDKSPFPRRYDAYMQRKISPLIKRKAKSVDPKPPSAKYVNEQTQVNSENIFMIPKAERMTLTPKIVIVPKPGSLPECAERIIADARRKEEDLNIRIEKLIKLKLEEVDVKEANIDQLTNEQIERLLATTKLEDMQYNFLLALLKRLKRARLKMLQKVF